MNGFRLVGTTVLITLLALQTLAFTLNTLYTQRRRLGLTVLLLSLLFIPRFLVPTAGVPWYLLTYLSLWAAACVGALVFNEHVPLLWHTAMAAMVLSWSLAALLGYGAGAGFDFVSLACVTAAAGFPALITGRWVRRNPTCRSYAGLAAYLLWFSGCLATAVTSQRGCLNVHPELWICLLLTVPLGVRMVRVVGLRGEPGSVSRGTLPAGGWAGLVELERLESAFFQQEKVVTLGYLAVSATHDFKNLLAYTALCAEHGLSSGDPEVRRETLAAIKDNVRTAAKSVSALLEAVSASRREDPKRLGLKAYMGSFLERVGKNYRMENIRFRLEVEEGVSVVFRPGEMEQVILNLVRNAVQAFRRRAVGPERRISFRCRRGTGAAVIEMCDNAGGVEPKLEAGLFEWNPEQGSSGLGLFLARKIITLGGGSIEYSRREGGSCFRLILPDNDA